MITRSRMRIDTVLGMKGSNVYLILDEKNVLIDAGADEKDIISFLRSKRLLNDESKRIDMLLLTHVHIDHILVLPRILEYIKHPIEIAVHETEFDHINDKEFTASYLFGIYDLPQIEPTIPLKDGDIINIGDISLEIIHTPGHSMGSISLYDKENKNLFSGDTVFPNGNFGRTDLFGGSSVDLVNSIKKLTMLDVKNIYPGHMNPVLGQGNKSIESSLRYAEMLLF